MAKEKKKVLKKKIVKKAKAKPKAKPKKKAKTLAKKVAPRAMKPIGKITHYYAHIKVAIVRFNTKVKAGTELYFKGATTDFRETSKSMQFDHKPVAVAMPKKQIGIKLKKRVREGDFVYKA